MCIMHVCNKSHTYSEMWATSTSRTTEIENGFGTSMEEPGKNGDPKHERKIGNFKNQSLIFLEQTSLSKQMLALDMMGLIPT